MFVKYTLHYSIIRNSLNKIAQIWRRDVFRKVAARRASGVHDHEHVASGALAQPARGVGEDGLGAAPFVGVVEGDDVLGVGDGLQAGHGAVLVAPPPDGDRGLGAGPLVFQPSDVL